MGRGGRCGVTTGEGGLNFAPVPARFFAFMMSLFSPRVWWQRSLLILLAGLFSLAGASAATPEYLSPRSGKWAHEVPKQTLTPDPRVTWGRLDNGFRFALLPHTGSPGRVTLQL